MAIGARIHADAGLARALAEPTAHHALHREELGRGLGAERHDLLHRDIDELACSHVAPAEHGDERHHRGVLCGRRLREAAVAGVGPRGLVAGEPGHAAARHRNEVAATCRGLRAGLAEWRDRAPHELGPGCVHGRPGEATRLPVRLKPIVEDDVGIVEGAFERRAIGRQVEVEHEAALARIAIGEPQALAAGERRSRPRRAASARLDERHLRPEVHEELRCVAEARREIEDAQAGEGVLAHGRSAAFMVYSAIARDGI